MKSIILASIIALLSIGCSFSKPKLQYSQSELNKEFKIRLTDEELKTVEIPFLIPDSIINDLKVRMSYMSHDSRLNFIISALNEHNIYNLKYQNGATYTAADLLKKGEGNCISLAHLLIGISRNFGISANYVYIVNNPTFSIYDHTISVNYHVMVGIEKGAGYHFYDFQPGYTKHYMSLNGVDDLVGIALHYNNLGAKNLQNLKLDQAELFLSIAHKLAPKNPEILSNYGIYHLRINEFSKARTFFQKAIEIDDTCYPAWHNLLYVTLKQNDYEMFALLKEKLTNVNSPSIKVFLANMAYREGEYEEVLSYLNGINPEMTKLFIVYLLKAQAYYKLGKFGYAKNLLEKYREFEPDDLHAVILQMELDKIKY